jgi:putative salt-induced outer membrane protein
MKLLKQISILILLGAFFAGTVYAEEPADKKWKDVAEFLFVQTSGNTDVRTLAFSNMLEYTFSEPLKGVWNISALDSETDGEQTAERYYTDLRLDYLFTDHIYAYILGSWLKDEFAGFDNRYNIGPGAGYKILIGPKHFLLAEAGLGYAHEDYVVEDDQAFMEGRAYGKYEYAFTEKNRFLLGSEYLQDFDDTSNYKSNSEAAVISALTDILSLKVSYEVRFQNRPIPSDLEKTDTVFGAAIVVTY